MTFQEQINNFRKTHEQKLEVFFFVFGFIFDAWMVTTPDEIHVLAQQAVYLFLIAFFIHYEMLFRNEIWQPQGFAKKLWPFRILALHFFLGTLLNVYSIFYIKSASLFSSLAFLLLMVGMILANELPFIKNTEKVGFKVALYAICLFSFLSTVFPMLFGFIGLFPFAFAMAGTIGVLALQAKILKRKIANPKVMTHAIFTPVVSVIAVFGLFYFLGLIPPVPLSVKEQGLYHNIEKREGHFFLSAEKSSGLEWPFWKTVFHAQPNDKIYFFSQIYSPARISDQINVHWFKEDAKGNWQSQDKVPVQIRGGREEGFRIFTFKSNYEPGQWKVEVETSSGVEISRLYFVVQPVAEDSSRELTVIER